MGHDALVLFSGVSVSSPRTGGVEEGWGVVRGRGHE
jgi:hypothetical protein